MEGQLRMHPEEAQRARPRLRRQRHRAGHVEAPVCADDRTVLVLEALQLLAVLPLEVRPREPVLDSFAPLVVREHELGEGGRAREVRSGALRAVAVLDVLVEAFDRLAVRLNVGHSDLPARPQAGVTTALRLRGYA